MTDIKSMKLYTHVERIENELAELGYAPTAALDVDRLSAFDQMHYHGTDALDQALGLLAPRAGDRWLEIGSGIGGPSRYLAAQAPLHLCALELQPDQHRMAVDLTRRCGLEDRVEHVCGDFLEHDFGASRFDATVSWLALYHIPDRPRLLQRCFQLLRPGGFFYTEDLCRLGNIGREQRADLERELYAMTLPSIETYREDLVTAGFEILEWVDTSADWADFTHRRLAAYRGDRARHERVQGAATVQALDDFYAAVDRHFQSGKLGGLRICARRPESAS